MNQNLIDELLAQHSLLASIIAETRKMSEDPDPSCAAIASKLKDFGKRIVEHLYLENNFIYKNIFNNPRADAVSVLSAKYFLEEMTSIQNGIMVFLKRYNNEDGIKSEFETFKIQLEAVEKILNTRIRLEEEGIFKIYADQLD